MSFRQGRVTEQFLVRLLYYRENPHEEITQLSFRRVPPVLGPFCWGDRSPFLKPPEREGDGKDRKRRTQQPPSAVPTRDSYHAVDGKQHQICVGACRCATTAAKAILQPEKCCRHYSQESCQGEKTMMG